MRKPLFGWISLSIAFTGWITATAQDPAAAGRDILAAHQDAVVTVQIVISQKFSMAGQSQSEEMTAEVTGTIVDPSGLTVLSLSETDPTSIFESMMGGGGGLLDGFQMESKLTDVEILLPNGKEISAEVVLRDADLDLIYIRPKEAPESPLPYVDLAKSADAQVLQQLVALGRLGRVGNRASSASFEYVHAIVQRPRKFYVLGSDNSQTALGSPVFDLSGQLIGLVMVRVIPGADSGGMMGMMMSGGSDTMLAIVLPAATVAQYVGQALGTDAVSPDDAAPGDGTQDEGTAAEAP